MSAETLSKLIFAGGIVHFSILFASAMVPFRMNWREDLAPLSRLHRQMYWTYGGYIVLSILSFGIISVTNSAELSRQSPLARAFCLMVFVFWLIRLALQAVFDVKEHLTTWWLRWGYRVLTFLFAFLTCVYGWAAVGAFLR
jgi:hypothetical protein